MELEAYTASLAFAEGAIARGDRERTIFWMGEGIRRYRDLVQMGHIESSLPTLSPEAKLAGAKLLLGLSHLETGLI